MHLHLIAALERIKKNVSDALSAPVIQQACHAAGYCWRERELGPAETVWAFLFQILHGNTACQHVVRLAQLTCSATAYCQARIRIPLVVFETLLEQTTEAARRITQVPLWRGHRTFVLDGSGFSMSDTDELRNHFGLARGRRVGCGFPTTHLLALFDSASGLLLKAWAAPLYTHDMKNAAKLHPVLQPGDVLVGDAAFASYAHLALLSQQNLFGVFRMHQRQLVSFRTDRLLKGKLPKGTKATHCQSRLIRKLGRFDQVVEYSRIGYFCPKWMDKEQWDALPLTMQVRELRYYTHQPGYRTQRITLVTHIIRCRHVSAGRVGRSVWKALGRGDELRALENHDEDGGAALRDGGGRHEGTLHLRHRL